MRFNIYRDGKSSKFNIYSNDNDCNEKKKPNNDIMF